MPNWTNEQSRAIETRDKSLLVSAAAGSGKTATLTERIIRSLTDTENPVCVDSLLVVTYTKVAAAELKAKVSKELSRAVKENPDNKHLQRQLYLLPSAKICTIDSFCGDILRSNCERVGIAPGYRIADGVECELLANQILSGIIDEIYAGGLSEVCSAEELFALSESLTDAKGADNINDALRALYRKLESCPDGVGAIKKLLPIYDPSAYDAPEKSPHISYIISRLHECAEHYISVAQKYETELLCGDDYELGVAGTCRDDMAVLQTIVDENSYIGLQKILNGINFPRFFAKRGGTKTAPILEYQAIRKSMPKAVLEFKKYFLYTEDELSALLSGLYDTISVLYRLLDCFDKAFREEKYRRGALSFADVERLAYQCLWQDGKPTDVALSLRESLSAVYIDEYQDVNDIQNEIFEALSRENNRFMVGDIKQSIYRFRQANPKIFTDTKRRLSDESQSGVAENVFMSKNFRSDEAIIDFVNSIFDRIFELCGESIDYRKEDRLVFGKTEAAGEYRRPEICVISKRPPKRQGDDDEENEIDTEDSDESDDGYLSEARVVALKIKSLLESGKLSSGEPIQPKDIAIILRSTRLRGEQFSAELARLGIPSRMSDDKDFFLSSEVLLALCLLNSIDNPRRDVYLAGLMTSPLYSFTSEELYKIKSSAKADTLYSSLVTFAEQTGDKKCLAFLSALKHYRRISEGISVDRLIYRLYRETGLLALAEKNGGGDNLRLLYDYARRYAEGDFKGLYNFISFINSIEDKETSFDDKRDGSDSKSVEIITAHSSKGLEYPVVFFAGATGHFKNHDSGSRLVFARDFGIGLKLRAEGSVALVNNPIYDILCHYKYREEYEEELRILYVVLTRARERLYVVGTSPSVDREKFVEKMLLEHEILTGYSAREQKSFMDIILAATGTRPIDECELLSGINIEEVGEDESPTEEVDPSFDEQLYKELISRFSFKYPYIHETTLPEKLSVSRASPTVLDGNDEPPVSLSEKPYAEEDKKEHLPAFIEGREADESAKCGIATHYFMQFCDLTRLSKTSAAEELSRLREGGFISERDAKRVRLSEIEAFCKSRLFADMLGARRLFRELRFNVHVPCRYFTENELRLEGLTDQTILVQGVIDCIIEYPDGSFGVFDYKTDRLTREELANRPLAEEKMTRRHRRQLEYYALAVEEIFGKKPRIVEVYSLHFGDTLSVGI